MRIFKAKKEIDIVYNQKCTAQNTLDRMSDTFDQEVYLAGGMLRDHFFKKPGEDFDIYMKVQEGFDYETFMISMLEGIHSLHSFELMSAKDAEGFGYNNKDIHSIYEGRVNDNDGEHPIQVIVLKVEPTQYINDSFCCSLSKTWQARTYGPVYSSAFLNSVADREIRFDFHSSGKFNHSYVNKIIDKFPDMAIDTNTENVLIRAATREAYWG